MGNSTILRVPKEYLQFLRKESDFLGISMADYMRLQAKTDAAGMLRTRPKRKPAPKKEKIVNIYQPFDLFK